VALASIVDVGLRKRLEGKEVKMVALVQSSLPVFQPALSLSLSLSH
jgi:hypothetical protein